MSQPEGWTPQEAERLGRIARGDMTDLCLRSKRVDGPKHSWKFWGDDPYIVCVFCDEMRDALTGRVIRSRGRS